ncbi:MAG: asparagine synthase (glutamine-hydrolyzing) [Bacteroidetes bacterium]|nr:asparagine synthase (glutamine-hydrolyzing) [Bacteroidota bacterium]
MCGITGFWLRSPLPPKANLQLMQMAMRIRHRGPDGFGYHLDDDAGLAMAHARLSIIDLETGEQPLYGQGNEFVLTANGEFYDYKRIRTSLRLEGFHFKTKSDSEIALPLYQKYGLDFVHHLRGEFAFALYDQKEDRLILARDRFGIKPLFYHIDKKGIYYGSEIKSIFAHPDVERQFSSEGILHQLMHTMVPGTTAFKDVHAIKPGYMLIIQKRNGQFDIKEHQYWDINFPEKGERDSSKSADYFIERVKEELVDAVSLRLEADVPVGCYLSGGIDSCSMLGLASSMQQSPVKAFTIGFDNDSYDESSIAREMAHVTQADQEEISLDANDLYGNNYITTMYHAERTFYNTLGVAKYCMSKRVNECGYRVVVTGEGSDELFGGYPAFKKDFFLHQMSDKHSHLANMDKSNSIFKGAILSDKQISHPALESVCGFTPSWIQSWIQTLAIARPLLNDDLQAELKDYDPIAAIAESFDQDQIKNRHVLDVSQYTWIKTMLECQILNWGGDRVDMANSMESRPAFLDHNLAQLATEIPPEMRINGSTEKWVLREAMKNVLPEVLYKREKFAFMAPPAHTSESKKMAVRLLINRFLDTKSVNHAGIFDLKRLKQFLADYEKDNDPVSLVRKDALLNHIIGIHILHEQFVEAKMGDLELV